MKDKRIKEGLDEALCDIVVSARQHGCIMDDIRGGKKMKKKTTVGFVLAMLMVFTIATSLALTVSAIVRSNMAQVVDMEKQGLLDRWALEDKEKFIRLMEKFEIEMDVRLLEELNAEGASREERDMIANQLIDAAYGEQMALPDYIDQPEEYDEQRVYAPDLYVIFSDLWRRETPDATEDEIETAFDLWVNEEQVYQPITWEEPEDEADVSEAEIKEIFISYLSDVLSFSGNEREHSVINAEYLPEHRLWKASYTISEEYVRPQAIEYLRETAQYDAETKVFEQSVWYTSTGRLLGYNSFEEYEFDQLIPRSAYPGIDKTGNSYKAFFRATVEEKAGFSQRWKPVVDAWLAEHPEFEKRFDQELWLDTTYILTRHEYGLPSEHTVSQEQAYEAARAAYLNSDLDDVSADMIDLRCEVGLYYDITDIDTPLWKISFDSYHSHEGESKAGYHVIINALTGEVIDEYALTSDIRNGDIITLVRTENTAEYVGRFL